MRRSQVHEPNQPHRNLAGNPSFVTNTGVLQTIRTNMFFNPGFENASGAVTVRTNLVTIPTATPGFWNARWYGSTGGTGVNSVVSGAGVFGGYAFRKTWSTANTGPSADVGVEVTVYGLTSGKTYTFSGHQKASVATKSSLFVIWLDSGNAVISNSVRGATLDSPAGVWVRPFLTISPPANAVAAKIVLGPYDGVPSPMNPGDTLDFDAFMAEESPALLPYFDGTYQAQNNLFANPSFETSSGVWNQVSAGIYSRDTTQGYAGTSCIKIAVNNAVDGAYFAGGAVTTVGGRVHTTSAWVKVPLGQSWRFDTDTSPDGSSWAVSNTTTHTGTGDWQRVSHTTTMPAGTTKVTIGFKSNANWSGNILVDAIMLEHGYILNPYYEGLGDFTYAWTGTANASTSVQRGVGVGSLNTAAANVVISSTLWKTGTKSARAIPISSSADTYLELNNLPAFTTGKTYTVSATCYLTGPQTGTLDSASRARQIVAYHSNGFTRSTATAPNAAGEMRLSCTFTVTDATLYKSIRLYNGASAGNGDVWWDDVLFEEHNSQLPYFDGNTAAAGDFSYAWTGTAHNSTSIQRAQTISTVSASRNTGVGWENSKFFVYQSTAEDGKKTLKFVSPAGTPNSQWRVAQINGNSSNGWQALSIKAGGRYTWFYRYRGSGWGAGQVFQTMIATGGAQNAVIGFDTAQPLNTTGWAEHRRTFTALRDGDVNQVLYMSLPNTPQATTDGVLEIREFMMVEGEYTGDFIDGSKPFSKWDGVANLSTSVGYPQQLIDFAGAPTSDQVGIGAVDYTVPDPFMGRTLYFVYETHGQAQSYIQQASYGIANSNGFNLQTGLAGAFGLSPRFDFIGGSFNGALGGLTTQRTVGRHVIALTFEQGLTTVRYCGDGGPDFSHTSLNPASSGWANGRLQGFSSVNNGISLRILAYYTEHDRATRVAISRYLGNKYGALVV